MPARYGGVPPHDNPQAYLWEHRLNWVMVAAALLSIPAFYLQDVAAASSLQKLGWEIDLLIFLIFSGELIWMLAITQQKSVYLKDNWLSLLIVLCSGLSMIGLNAQWVALVRLLRVFYVSLILARLFSSLRNISSPDAVISLLILGVFMLSTGGAAFYWLEPTITNFGDGIWLAFATAATVGYGDFVPTTLGARLVAITMVLIGFALLSLVTASFAAFFLGEDEKRLRHEMHLDIKELREEVAQLRKDLQQGRESRSGGGAEYPGN